VKTFLRNVPVAVLIVVANWVIGSPTAISILTGPIWSRVVLGLVVTSIPVGLIFRGGERGRRYFLIYVSGLVGMLVLLIDKINDIITSVIPGLLALDATNIALSVILVLTVAFLLLEIDYWKDFPKFIKGQLDKGKKDGPQLSDRAQKSWRLRKPTRREFYLVLFIAVLGSVSTYSASIGIDLGVFVATAIGSLSYVLVAVYDKYIVRATLALIYDLNNPDLFSTDLVLIDPQTRLPTMNARSIRVLVQNEGGKAARGCVGYLKLISREPGCTMLSFEPKVLGWVNIADKNLIPRGGFATLGVALSVEKGVQLDHNRCDKQSGNTLLQTWAHTPEIFQLQLSYRLQDAFCVGTYLFDIVVYSQDSAPVSRRFALKISPSWKDTKMVEP